MGNIWANNFFQENLALSRTTSNVFLIPCQNLEKLGIQFEEKAWTEGWTGGRTDRHYFIGPLPLLPEIQEYFTIPPIFKRIYSN